jgi:hypothetical protein
VLTAGTATHAATACRTSENQVNRADACNDRPYSGSMGTITVNTVKAHSLSLESFPPTASS